MLIIGNHGKSMQIMENSWEIHGRSVSEFATHENPLARTLEMAPTNLTLGGWGYNYQLPQLDQSPPELLSISVPNGTQGLETWTTRGVSRVEPGMVKVMVKELVGCWSWGDTHALNKLRTWRGDNSTTLSRTVYYLLIHMLHRDIT